MCRYKLADGPQDSKQYRSLVRRQFPTGVSFTGRESREFALLLAIVCILPGLFRLLFLSFCHVVVLFYASDLGLPLGLWQASGKIYVYLIHLIMECAESGSTATLYLHGLTHAFPQAHLPIQCCNEAWECDLRLGTTFATLTTCLEDSIKETLTHELYIKFWVRKSRQSQVHLWRPVRRALVLEQCGLSASPEWRLIVERIL